MTKEITFEERVAEQLRAYAAPAARPPRREAVAIAVEAARNAHGVQRRWWPAWRSSRMNSYAKLIVAAAAVLVVAVVGYQFLPRSAGVAGEPTISPLPSPTLLAQGNFHAKGADVELNATGDGDSVEGTMIVGDPDVPLFAVDLTCALTAEDGRILIAGDTTQSNSEWAAKGEVTAIVLEPGSPVHAVFAFQSDAPSASSCTEFLESIVDNHFTTAIGDGALEPIEGTVELRP
jgi:hypothetical protein